MRFGFANARLRNESPLSASLGSPLGIELQCVPKSRVSHTALPATATMSASLGLAGSYGVVAANGTNESTLPAGSDVLVSHELKPAPPSVARHAMFAPMPVRILYGSAQLITTHAPSMLVKPNHTSSPNERIVPLSCVAMNATASCVGWTSIALG